MIFYSLTQLKSFGMTIFASIIFLLVIFLLKILFCYNFCNVVGKNIQLFLFTLTGGLIFLLVTNLYCYGEYSIFLLSTYLVVFFYLHKSLKKLLDFLSLKVYYIYIKLLKLEKNIIARKFGSIKD